MAEDLYDTTDYRRFLSAALARQDRTRRELAQALERSDAYVSLVLSGSRRLDPDLVEPAARFVKLDEDETAYLSALVDLDSRSPRARRSAWAVVQARQRHHAVSDGFNEDIAAMYERWYIPAIFELAACESFRPDPRWIAGTLCPRITHAQAEEAIMLLVRLGRLEPDDEGGLRRVEPQLWSPVQLPPGEVAERAATSHRATLSLASEGLDRFRFNERHILSFTAALSEERYEALLARLEEVELELVHLATEPDTTPNRVYHLAFQLFPMSLFSDTDYDPEEPTQSK